MRVVATDTGFFDGVRRKAGTVFEVPEGVSAKWFEPVESAAKVVAPKSKAPKGAKANEPQTFSEISKKDGAEMPVMGTSDLV